jgi:hypothetical protein
MTKEIMASIAALIIVGCILALLVAGTIKIVMVLA